MEVNKKTLDDLISVADKIIAANETQIPDLFGEVSNPEEISKIMELPSHNPEKLYDLYYKNIQKFLGEVLPKNNEITKVIREEVCILLAHKELSGLTYGVRGSDSRQATEEDMKHMVDVLTEWSATPTDYLKLAYILLDKCKELGYIPKEREIKDYLK